MEKIIIDNNLLTQENMISSGYEGSIFLVENKIYKIFKDTILSSQVRINSKIDKLLFLHEIGYIENMCYPEKLLFNDKGLFIGYSMNYHREKINLNNFFSSNIDLQKKIIMFNIIENITLNLAENNIYVVDNNLRNYMFTEEDKIIILDVDSVSTFNNRTECLPTYFFDYYLSRFNDKIDYNYVKYTLALQFLVLINNIDRRIIRYYDSTNDIVCNELISIFNEYNQNKIKLFFENNNYNQRLSKILIK